MQEKNAYWYKQHLVLLLCRWQRSYVCLTVAWSRVYPWSTAASDGDEVRRHEEGLPAARSSQPYLCPGELTRYWHLVSSVACFVQFSWQTLWSFGFRQRCHLRIWLGVYSCVCLSLMFLVLKALTERVHFWYAALFSNTCVKFLYLK